MALRAMGGYRLCSGAGGGGTEGDGQERDDAEEMKWRLSCGAGKEATGAAGRPPRQHRAAGLGVQVSERAAG